MCHIKWHNIGHNLSMWRVVGDGGVKWGHPSTNHNLPHGWVVVNIVPFYVAQEFFIVERVWNKWPSTLLNTRTRWLTLALTSWKSRMTLQRSEKKKKKNVASYYRHCYQSQVFWSKLLIYFIVYVMGMDCTYILSISYYGILHDIIFISYYITVLCMISYSYSHHIIYLCIILY